MCDIIGAFLIVAEVVKVFRGSHSITLLGSGAINGSARTVTNPELEKHERSIRKWMCTGLIFLFIGFSLQGIGTWLPICYPAPAPATHAQAQ